MIMPQDFSFLARVLKLRSGVALTPDKRYLLDSRLMPVARRNGFQTLSELVFALRQAEGDALLAQVAEAMTSEEAQFFGAPFDSLAGHVVPALLRAAGECGTLRVWSAGCATGQEPYSIAMQLMEMRRRLAGWRIEIVATDPCARSLKKAREGQYTQFEVQRGLPIQLLLKYFRKVGWHWQIDESVRAMVDFRQRDLLDDGGDLGAFDVVFCRDLLSCLDAAGRRAVLGRFGACLRPGGFLVLGTAETVLDAGHGFAPAPGLRGIFERLREGAREAPRASGAVIPLRGAARL